MTEDDRPPELRVTNDYASMVMLGREAGLETNSLTNVLVAYGFYIGDHLVGCACLRKVSGAFAIECLAVEERWRGRGLGSTLVEKIEEEARMRGVERLWAVARQPTFFERNGYHRKPTTESEGPNLNDCVECAQYLRDCHPAIMIKSL